MGEVGPKEGLTESKKKKTCFNLKKIKSKNQAKLYRERASQKPA